MVVDNTSFWRMHEDVPLVVAGVNDDAAADHNGLVANPNCTTMQMMVALKPILDAAGIERLIVSTYQSVSGTGRKAIEELRAESQAVLDGDKISPPQVYPHQVAFNVVPQVENFKDGDDYTTEERKVMAETRKILGLTEDVGISATCVRVPVVTGHSESVNVQTAKDLSPEECRELLSEFPGLVVLDDPGAGIYPLPIAAARRDEVLVGRIRRDPSHGAASTSGSSATTSARGRRPTPSRWRSCCTSGISSAFRRARASADPFSTSSQASDALPPRPGYLRRRLRGDAEKPGSAGQRTGNGRRRCWSRSASCSPSARRRDVRRREDDQGQLLWRRHQGHQEARPHLRPGRRRPDQGQEGP